MADHPPIMFANGLIWMASGSDWVPIGPTAGRPAVVGPIVGQCIAAMIGPAGHYVEASITPEQPPALTRVMTVGELVGWRVWRVKDGYLRSYAFDRYWAPSEPMTAVNIDDEGMTGVWAFRERHLALTKLLTEARDRVMAYGAVALWGTVIEHELGYRGQFAKVLSIDELTGKPPSSGRTVPLSERQQHYRLRRQRLFQLRRRYGVRDFAAYQQAAANLAEENAAGN